MTRGRLPRRWMQPGLLLVAALATSACRATVPEGGAVGNPGVASTTIVAAVETAAPALVETPASEATSASDPAETVTAGEAAATASADGGAPVTPIMAKLKLAGEPYAAAGDPHAPLTVIEFSDYG